MLAYIIRRLLLFIPMMLVVSVLIFVLIQLPPGDFLSSELTRLAQSGQAVDAALISSLRARYGLDRPMYEQYLLWMRNILLYGDFGRSFQWNEPVSSLIWERLMWTFIISIGSLLFTWMVAFPIGVYSAVYQYSPLDYVATFLGMLGRAIPNFLLALILMWLGYTYFDINMGGLFSAEYQRGGVEHGQSSGSACPSVGAIGCVGYRRHCRLDPHPARQSAR